MKDKGEAITAVVLLGLGLSAIIRALVIGGSGFGSATCQNSSPADCTLSLFMVFWIVAAILVGSVYLALLIRRGVRHRQTAVDGRGLSFSSCPDVYPYPLSERISRRKIHFPRGD